MAGDTRLEAVSTPREPSTLRKRKREPAEEQFAHTSWNEQERIGNISNEHHTRDWKAIKISRRDQDFHGSSSSHELVLQPIILAPRARVPLIWVDSHDESGAPTSSEHHSRLFRALIPALEPTVPQLSVQRNEDEEGHGQGAEMVLIVRRSAVGGAESVAGNMYAIERIRPRIYALVKLAPWLTPIDIEDLTSEGRLRRKKQKLVPGYEHGNDWWKSAAVSTPITVLATEGDTVVPATTLPKLAMSPPPVQSENPREPSVRTDLESTHLLLDVKSHKEDGKSNAKALEDPLHELATQYLETLYCARTSLAYFVKGPMHRARATVQANPSLCSDLPAIEDTENNQLPANQEGLIEFLRASILGPSLLEKKFRSTLPDLVSSLSPRSDESPEATKKKRRTKKRKWRPKRDKSGLFTNEGDYVSRWWNSDSQSSVVAGVGEVGLNDRADVAARKGLSALRKRETYLQITLILEVLALESGRTDDPKMPPPQSKERKPSKGKKQDLVSHLEMLTDGLAIQHTLSSSPIKPEQSDIVTTATHTVTHSGDDEADELKNFCTEVIIPFFLPRIPDIAGLVCKKFGGPTAPSPEKRRPKPGEAATRMAPVKTAKRPLERTASVTMESQTRGRPVPSLHRSATDSNLDTHVKREPSIDITQRLADIPPAPVQQPRARPSLLELSKGRREVDLSAMSQTTASKLQRKKDVEAKLQEAISTLRKPNREKAVAELAEMTDSKALAKNKAQPQKRKDGAGRKALAPPLVDVMVQGTPSKKSIIKETPMPQRSSMAANLLQARSSDFVPSSSSRSLQRQSMPHAGLLDSPQAARRGVETSMSGASVPQTGHRNRLSTLGFTDTDLHLQPTPSRTTGPVPRSSMFSLQQTPSKHVRNFSVPGLKLTDAEIEGAISATPLRPLAQNTQRAQSPKKGATEGDEEKDIYDALGWND